MLFIAADPAQTLASQKTPKDCMRKISAGKLISEALAEHGCAIRGGLNKRNGRRLSVFTPVVPSCEKEAAGQAAAAGVHAILAPSKRQMQRLLPSPSCVQL
jgi:hypothetical protein